MSTPNFTAKIEYYGFRSLNIGLSGYFGKPKVLYNGIDKKADAAIAKADSSTTGVSMLGVDARYNFGDFKRGQFYYSTITNTQQYNVLPLKTANRTTCSAMMGYLKWVTMF
ncbi:MAG: hypothetical protein IPH20_10740 [Bacteroidales bacterium]|nr:hypothetical protein [Bacteroidales bacterium]